MARRDEVSRFLPGVADVAVNVVVGRAGEEAEKQHAFTRRTLPIHVTCPSGCRQGGFDLAEDLHARVISKNREESQGLLRCRGYHEMGRGRRKACDRVLAYAVRVTYGIQDRL